MSKVMARNISKEKDYDAATIVRGVHAGMLEKPQSITITHEDGTVTTQKAPALMEIADDVYAYFPTSQAVNEALRGLIALIPTATPSPISKPISASTPASHSQASTE